MTAITTSLQAKGRLAKFHSQKNCEQNKRRRAGEDQIANGRLRDCEAGIEELVHCAGDWL
jgi:hypothetical protein